MKKKTNVNVNNKKQSPASNFKNYSQEVIKNYSIEVAMINEINKRMGAELR